MKTVITVLCIILAAHVYADDAALFQLFSGSIQGQDSRPVPIVLKINTQTGQTWQLLEVPVPGMEGHVTMTGWTSVSEDLLNQMQKFEHARGRSNTPTPKPRVP
jgi:hypothetical protein